jgi:glyoxylase-like metal-dependent hydrolase (beta-lactamase superfamily II)
MTQPQFIHISPHVRWLAPDSTTDRPVLGAISGARGTLLVDAGNSAAHAQVLLHELSKTDVAAPTFVALTHWHWDHVFGTAALDLPTVAHTETKRIVAAMAQLDWRDAALDRRVEEGVEIAFCRDMIKAELPDRSNLTLRPPNLGFTECVELELGGVTCHIVHVGGDHAHDSTVVYVPDDKIMFLGDCIYPDIYHTARRYTTTKLFPLLDRLLSYDTEWYLAGHHPAPMSRADLATEAALLKTIGQRVDEGEGDRAAILADLPHLLGAPLNDDHVEIVDAFVAGRSSSVRGRSVPSCS